ncbi:hypothetical protein L208DRAFT_1325601 [Tricholoma matsutake]|nr:hypothetical protein L208DRAFT_1325601 [Tricholoma matsutake 945]
MFNHLPPELALAVMVYLPLSSIAVTQQVCSRWNDFVAENRDAIYHKAAAWHDLIPSPTTSFEELGICYSRRGLKGVNNWEDFCRRRLDITNAWSGTKVPSTIRHHHAPANTVHRIKVDEIAGYILTTSWDGGLRVTDLDEDVVLWSLPQTYVRQYAHCEYGEGFIIFDRYDGSKEVWRRSSDCTPEGASHVVPESKPTILTAEYLSLRSNHSMPIGRGHFQPWAHLHPLEPTRAFRFSYPNLGVAALNSVYLWDVRTGVLFQHLEGTQSNEWYGTGNASGSGDQAHRPLGDINYIEIGPRHVVLCGTRALRVFAWDTGRCVLDVPSSQGLYGRWRFGISAEGWFVHGAAVMRHVVKVEEPMREQGDTIDEFIAVHISTCGNHLAALLHSSRLLIMRNFERAVTDNISIYDLTVEVQLGSPRFSSRYLAYEDGRIAVATCTGIFIVRPEFLDSDLVPDAVPGQDEDENPPLVLEIMRIPSLVNRTCLSRVTCLQMTDTGLFLNWDPEVQTTSDDLSDLSLQGEPLFSASFFYLLFLWDVSIDGH